MLGSLLFYQFGDFIFVWQGPPGRPGLPGADGMAGPPGTMLMLPVSTHNTENTNHLLSYSFITRLMIWS